MKLSSVLPILTLFGLSSATARGTPHTDYFAQTLPAANVSIQENLWAGVMLDKEAYDRVGAKLVVPGPKLPVGGNSSAANCMTMWVGIGGNCNKTLQGGITACIKEGEPIYRTWAIPNPWNSLGPFGVDIKEGDELQITVAQSGHPKEWQGWVQIENLTTDKSGRWEFVLGCQGTVMWMVQPYKSEYPFADFGTVGFTDAYARRGQETFNITDATLFEVKKNNKELTKSTYTDNTLTIKYIG